MKPAREHPYRVEVDLPGEAFACHPWEPVAIALRLRALWLVELVRERRLGYGKAAQLAGMPKAVFVQLMGRHGVSAVDYDAEQIDVEIQAARELSGSGDG